MALRFLYGAWYSPWLMVNSSANGLSSTWYGVVHGAAMVFFPSKSVILGGRRLKLSPSHFEGIRCHHINSVNSSHNTVSPVTYASRHHPSHRELVEHI